MDKGKAEKDNGKARVQPDKEGVIAAVDLPIKVPTTHRRRQFIYYLDGSPIIEKGEWAVASFDIMTLGRLVGYAVARYTYVEGVGYDRPEWHFPETKEEALALVLELTCDDQVID